jgi:hypothetical protein
LEMIRVESLLWRQVSQLQAEMVHLQRLRRYPWNFLHAHID